MTRTLLVKIWQGDRPTALLHDLQLNKSFDQQLASTVLRRSNQQSVAGPQKAFGNLLHIADKDNTRTEEENCTACMAIADFFR